MVTMTRQESTVEVRGGQEAVVEMVPYEGEPRKKNATETTIYRLFRPMYNESMYQIERQPKPEENPEPAPAEGGEVTL
jgi:hypothetical protein